MPADCRVTPNHLSPRCGLGSARGARARCAHGHRKAAPPGPRPRYRRAGCSADTDAAVELGGEGLLESALPLAERARQRPRHGVEHDHRGQLAAGEHVGPDRQSFCREMLDDPLVEALEARGEQRQLLLRRPAPRRPSGRAAVPAATTRSPAAAGGSRRRPATRRRRHRLAAPCRRLLRTGRRPPARRATA